MERMGKLIDLTGQRFGRWIVLRRAPNNENGTAMWFCRCDCGKERTVIGRDLRNGKSRSCGCLSSDIASTRLKKYTFRDKRLYWIWCAMRKRCSNPNHQFYYVYGGRGITVCQEWAQDFGAFQQWAFANGYRADLTIDRIDNDMGYSPENCRWSSVEEQANNHRNNVKITFWGKTLSISRWARIVGINEQTLRSRVAAGWTAEQTLTIKPDTQNRIK